MMFNDIKHPPKAKLSLGQWLIRNINRAGPIGDLAKAAKTDPRFPVDGNYEAISKRLHQQEADIEMHEALDEAETEWRSQ